MKQPVEHLVLMGVAGCGKTTAAINLHNALGWPVAEADDFHPEANIAKMSRGVPLTDEDRWPWLESLRAWMSEQADRGTRTNIKGSPGPVSKPRGVRTCTRVARTSITRSQARLLSLSNVYISSLTEGDPCTQSSF